jgi:hypothetical protein
MGFNRKVLFLTLFSMLILNTLAQVDVVSISDSGNEQTKKVTEVKLPEMVVVQPVRRRGSSHSSINVGPCGGLEKMPANTLSNTGDKINAIWEIRNPIANGNCTVSMSAAMEENFIPLKPISNGILFNSDLSFPCGRQLGFEFQEFELPKDYACDHCTLQLQWTTPVGSIYSCSDMLVLGNKVENCLSKCLNGGACVNGKCVCRKNFDGEFCENDLTASSNIGWIILIILIIAAGAVGGYLIFKKNQDSWTKSGNEDQYNNQFIENNKKETEIK